MAFAAKMILDSISPFDVRLCTIEATYPRFVHAEVLTHRDRERNSASSRAIPWMSWRPKFPAESEAEYAMNKADGGIKAMHDKCMKKMILTDPVVPLKFGREQRGMQQGAHLEGAEDAKAREIWLNAMINAVNSAQQLADLGVHKSLVNRLTEPFMWITVVMTATEWNNFFRLRCHPAAEQHFFKIACMIREVIRESKPTRLNFGEIHAPYVSDEEKVDIVSKFDSGYFTKKWDHSDWLIQGISTGRCARVSYLTHDGKRDFKKDIELYETLLKPPGDPDEDIMHASPFGHVAKPVERHHRSGPFIGWKQFRKEFPNENVEGCTV